jgi:hypothetical protein
MAIPRGALPDDFHVAVRPEQVDVSRCQGTGVRRAAVPEDCQASLAAADVLEIVGQGFSAIAEASLEADRPVEIAGRPFLAN